MLVRVLREATGFPALPLHVAYRLHAVLGDHEVLWADSDVNVRQPDQGPQKLGGSIVIFTATTVVQLKLDGTALRPQPDERTVALEAWPRSALRSLRFEAAENADTDWESAWNAPWPRGGRARLTYEGQTVVVLPLSQTGDGLADLLPQLLDDLRP